MRKCPGWEIAHRRTIRILNQPDRGPRSLGCEQVCWFSSELVRGGGRRAGGMYRQAHKSENKAEPQDWPKQWMKTRQARGERVTAASPQHMCPAPLATIIANTNLLQGPLGGSINLYCVSYLSAKCHVLSHQGRETGWMPVITQKNYLLNRKSPPESGSLNIPNGRWEISGAKKKNKVENSKAQFMPWTLH